LSKPLLIDPTVLRRLNKLPKAVRVECLVALCELPEHFGQQHVHSGLGIRKIGKNLFECRGNISLRFIFQDRPTDLFVTFLGTHDEIKSLLKRGKFR
jgi:hypothetical protein